MERLTELKEVGLPEAGIDPKVANLVRGLTSVKIKTQASCEGHLDHGHSHPWVGINPFSFAKIAALNMLLENYNQKSDVKWECATNWVLPTNTSNCSSCNEDDTVKSTEEELTSLQENSERLAQFLFDHRKDKKIQPLLEIHGW